MCVTNTKRPVVNQSVSLAPSQLPVAAASSSANVLQQRMFSQFGGGASTLPAFQAPCAPSLLAPQPQLSQQQNVLFASAAAAAPSSRPTQQKHAPSKPKPKRRRKPQKPGQTAKGNDRHFVVHNYHDHANDVDEVEDVASQEDQNGTRRRGGVSVAFPLKLHSVLDQVERDGLAHVISWQEHGRSFSIHNPKEFVDHVMPKYFRQTKLTSFQRQLNLYGFCRLTRGKDAGGYYHECT